MAEEWLHCFKELSVPHTDEPNLINTLGDPVKIRSWQVRTKLSSADLSRQILIVNSQAIRLTVFCVLLHFD